MPAVVSVLLVPVLPAPVLEEAAAPVKVNDCGPCEYSSSALLAMAVPSRLAPLTNRLRSVSAVPPFYYDFSAAELTAHYMALADAVPLPVVVYNFGGKVPKLTTEVILALLDDRRFAGVKHTSTDLYQMERFKAHRPDAAIFNGYDEMCLAGLAMGADGAIGTTYNFMGGVFVAIRDAVRAGRMDAALTLQRRANRVIDTLVEVGVFPGAKAMLRMLGQDCGPCRPPFGGLREGAEARLLACLDSLNDRAAAA